MSFEMEMGRVLQIPPNDEPGVNTGDRDRDINLILFMFFGLAVGAVITFILNRNSYLGLPYTVGVFITGALISVIADHTQFLGDLGELCSNHSTGFIYSVT